MNSYLAIAALRLTICYVHINVVIFLTIIKFQNMFLVFNENSFHVPILYAPGSYILKKSSFLAVRGCYVAEMASREIIGDDAIKDGECKLSTEECAAKILELIQCSKSLKLNLMNNA